MQKYFREKLHKGLTQEIKVKKLLVKKKSLFQKIEIFDSYIYGRVLALDNVVQVTEKDENAYSEMLVHPLVQLLEKKPTKVLIVGGGDGAVAKELLKYKFIKKIDLVDIDQEVVNLSKRYLIKINDNSLTNNKLNIFYEDAFSFIKNTKNKYDIIIADRPDPIGAGKSLFKKEFYKRINNIISPEGVSVFQSGVPFFQKKELKTVLKDVSTYFKYSGYYLTVVPSYVGGFMALVWSSNKVDISKISISKQKYAVSTNYYNQNILEASFIAPSFIKKL